MTQSPQSVPPAGQGSSGIPPVPSGRPEPGWQPAAHGQSWQRDPASPQEQPWQQAGPSAQETGRTPSAPTQHEPDQQPSAQAPGQQQSGAPQPWPPAPVPGQQFGTAPQPWQQAPAPGQQQFGATQPWQPAQQFGPAPHPWLPQPQQLGPPPALPVEPRLYHEFLRTPRLRWWRPVLALLMGAALFLIASTLLTLPAMFYDISTGRTTMDNYTSLDAFVMTPAFFLANNVALAACVPIAGLTQWACFGQRPRWMSAVTGAFRWRWFGECVVWILPLFGISLVLDVMLSGGLGGLRVTPDTGFMLAAILLTTPLQSAGEEYLLRGLGQRSIAAWLPTTAGLVLSTLVTAVIFMLLHGAGDPWLNAFYLFFAVISSLLAWRTGGLEASVAMHAVNNVVSMTFLPFTDFSDMFNRSEGTGSPVLLVQFAILAGSLALVLWRAKLRGIVRAAAPAAVALPAGVAVPAGMAVPGPAAAAWPAQPDQAHPARPPWRQDDAHQTH